MAEKKPYFVHESAYVHDDADIGDGTSIWHFTHIRERVTIGEHCNIGQNVYLAPGVVVGNGVKIQNNVSVYEGVTIEDYVFVGPSAVFTNIKIPRSAFPRRDQYVSTLVKQGATIGANATVVCGGTLGEGCFIAAGAVVTGDIPPYALMVGTKAAVAGWRCECGEVIVFDKTTGEGACVACHRRYHKESERVTPIDTREE
jgi:UDP-2-acetamido-3-amino-2,3-dideoxy-glucuronate N-acetyltransferase